MNNIEQYLFDNPELLKKSMERNEPLLNDLKDRFAEFIENGDPVGKYLLSMALFEILRTVKDASKAVFQAEIAERFGLSKIMATEGK